LLVQVMVAAVALTPLAETFEMLGVGCGFPPGWLLADVTPEHPIPNAAKPITEKRSMIPPTASVLPAQ
jgi:hypothetical protein